MMSKAAPRLVGTIMVGLLLASCGGPSEKNGSPAAGQGESTSTSYAYPNPTPSETEVPVSASSKPKDFCDTAQEWAAESGAFREALATIGGPGLFAGVYFPRWVDKAQGLRDAAPEKQSARFTPLFESRLRLFELAKQEKFDLSSRPFPSLFHQESLKARDVFRYLRGRCGISKADFRKGAREFAQSQE